MILIPSTIGILKKSIHILAEGVPHELDFYEVGESPRPKVRGFLVGFIN